MINKKNNKKLKRNKFLSSPFDYSVYETKKHFVKNEVVLDEDLNYHVKHTYRKKSQRLENKLNKKLGKPTLTKKHGRVWH